MPPFHLTRPLDMGKRLQLLLVTPSLSAAFVNRIGKPWTFPTQATCRSRAGVLFSSYGEDMNQEDMMESDMLVAVDHNDILIDASSVKSTSKKLAHTFSEDQPRGILHRAFSFFLFNQENKMLLTQRASSKITFPGVWTNTCCSHPLHGMTPNEVDPVPAAYPNFPGAKHAAIRKLKHELGIEPQYIQHDKITFISRFHYWASDTLTYGEEAPWGEHEVDYILFFKLPEGVDLPLNPCPEEVEDYKYVSISELKEMMKDPELLWSPWFVGIMEKGGFDWWEDMERSLAGEHTNSEVYFFDPPAAHVAAYNKPSHRRQTGVLSTEGVLQV